MIGDDEIAAFAISEFEEEFEEVGSGIPEDQDGNLSWGWNMIP